MTTLVGLREFQAAIDRWEAQAEAATRTAVIKAGDAVKVGAAAHIHNRTGHLAESIRLEGPVRTGFGAYEAKVGPTIVYGRRVELTHDGAFEYFRPGFDEARETFPAIFRDAWLQAQRGR